MTPKKRRLLHTSLSSNTAGFINEGRKKESGQNCYYTIEKYFSGNESWRIFPGETPNNKTVKRP